MVLPDEVRLLDGADVHQHHRALKVVEQDMVRRVGDAGKQTLEKAVRLVGIAFGVEENEGFADVVVAGLIDAKLTVHHETAKDEYRDESPEKAVMARNPHER